MSHQQTNPNANEPPKVLRAPLDRTVQLLLASRVPARVAWVDTTERPRVVPLWFDWFEDQLSVTTFAGTRKLDELEDGASVAVTIDTEDFPYRNLRIRGTVTLEASDDVTPQYRRAAQRYLGETPGLDWCDRLAGTPQVLIRIHPTQASFSNSAQSSFMTDPTD